MKFIANDKTPEMVQITYTLFYDHWLEFMSQVTRTKVKAETRRYHNYCYLLMYSGSFGYLLDKHNTDVIERATDVTNSVCPNVNSYSQNIFFF